MSDIPTTQPGAADALKVHQLKTDPEVFEAVSQGLKTFEIRKNDREFGVGDQLHLLETKYTGAGMKAGLPLEYTGRECTRAVSHILTGPLYGLEQGWVILSFSRDAEVAELRETATVSQKLHADAESVIEDLRAEVERLKRWEEMVRENSPLLAKLSVAEAQVATLREALEWYADQAKDCRKLTSEGEKARNALDRDGGTKARAALSAVPATPAPRDQRIERLEKALVSLWERLPAPEYITDGMTGRELKRYAACVAAALAEVRNGEAG